LFFLWNTIIYFNVTRNRKEENKMNTKMMMM